MVGGEHIQVRNCSRQKNAIHGFAGRQGITIEQPLAHGIWRVSFDVNRVADDRRGTRGKRLDAHVSKIGSQVQSHAIGDA